MDAERIDEAKVLRERVADLECLVLALIAELGAERSSAVVEAAQQTAIRMDTQAGNGPLMRYLKEQPPR